MPGPQPHAPREGNLVPGCVLSTWLLPACPVKSLAGGLLVSSAVPGAVQSSSDPPFQSLLPTELEGGSILLKEAPRGEVIPSIEHTQKVAEPGFEVKFA